jgi:hypothetical protein
MNPEYIGLRDLPDISSNEWVLAKVRLGTNFIFYIVYRTQLHSQQLVSQWRGWETPKKNGWNVKGDNS